MIKRLKASPADNSTEAQRLSAMAEFCNTYFASISQNVSVQVASTMQTPPEVNNQNYLYINPERYHRMRVQSYYTEMQEDLSYLLWISADYHASYSFDFYNIAQEGMDYSCFDVAKKLLAQLFYADLSAYDMSFMNSDEINNLSNTNLSDSFIVQRFRFVAHFIQNDIINLPVQDPVTEIEIKGIISNMSIDVIINGDVNGHNRHI